MLHLNKNLQSLIDELWNKFWSGGISNPLTAIEQITYLLFMKKIDALDEKREGEYNDGFTDKFISIFEGKYPKPTPEEEKDIKEGKDKVIRVDANTLRWSQIKQMTSEKRLTYINQFVFPFIKDLKGENSHFTKHMKNAVFVIQSPSLLHEAMFTIEKIYDELEKDEQTLKDIQGDVYEYLLSEIASAGKNGQFRTPRHIINLVVELVEPKLGNKIIDPACGSGGFLIGAYQYIVTDTDPQKEKLKPDENGFIRSKVSSFLGEDVKKILDNSIKGYDIDVTMVRLGLMNLIMHGIDDPNIDYTDTLSKSYQKYKSELGTFDIVLANPPFTGNLNTGEKDDELNLDTTKTELLFIDRIHSMLKVGGTAGIIIPQGVLFGSGNAFKEARKLMIEKSQLKAVVTMPSGVFKPYAGVATAILVFTKAFDAKEDEKVEENYDVFFYDMQSDGYSLDDKRAKLEGYGDLQDIIQKYKARVSIENDKKEKYFLVKKDEIVENSYDLSFGSYQEITYTEEKYDEPKDILDELFTLEDTIQKELRKIKSLYL